MSPPAPRPAAGPRVLYIAYWGATEPLGQSLVVPAVVRLAAAAATVTLVTFEKPADLARRDVMARTRADLAGGGVRWVPLRYHKDPKLPATAYDIARGVAQGVVERLRCRPDVVHARTFIGGLIGYTLARSLGLKFVYHNEGFYPDEQVDGGVWAAGGRSHRTAKALEQRMYDRADGIIALSHRAKDQIDAMPAVRRKGTPTVVVPSCVDLDLFRPVGRESTPRGRETRLVYIGAIGRRYRFGDVARFAATFLREYGPGRLRVLSRAEPSLVASLAGPSGLSPGDWSLDCVPHSEVPGELAVQDAGLFFLSQGISEHGCSPTKVGEYWASGLPVVTTPNVSDTESVIRRERVGVVVRGHTDADYRHAARELLDLLRDPDLPRRCRSAAESHYALAPACAQQMALYREILNGPPARVARGHADPSGRDTSASSPSPSHD